MLDLEERNWHEVPWDLRSLLYLGGAGAKANQVTALISAGKLGTPIAARLPLVLKLHDIIHSDLIGGGSRHTAITRIRELRTFYQYADRAKIDPREDNAKTLFVNWTADLHHRQRLRQIAASSVYQMGRRVALLLADVLDVPTKTLVRAARIHYPGASRRILGTQTDKQMLTVTFAYGHALLDITESLSLEAIRGSLPVELRFRTGEVIYEWSGAISADKLKNSNYDPSTLRVLRANLRHRKTNTDLRTRYPLVNLRMEAELLIFIAQTGMNLAQATALKTSKFCYQSHHDGYAVRRTYKNRRRGEVEFLIYSEYRAVFQRYLAWRNALFPDDPDGLLFPFVPQPGHHARKANFRAIKKKCSELGLQFAGPRILRRTRINWLLRRSQDPGLTAEMAQHTQQMLLGVYQKPNYQVAMIEATRFYQQTDPEFAPPGPGTCIEPAPKALPDTPVEAPQPDCISPAGCLFCVHQRDIDGFDHVWSLASYRHLKSLEMTRYRSDADECPPAALVVARATAKLRAFEDSSEIRAAWVQEAQARMEEGHYHEKWDGFIQLAEIGV